MASARTATTGNTARTHTDSTEHPRCLLWMGALTFFSIGEVYQVVPREYRVGTPRESDVPAKKTTTPPETGQDGPLERTGTQQEEGDRTEWEGPLPIDPPVLTEFVLFQES